MSTFLSICRKITSTEFLKLEIREHLLSQPVASNEVSNEESWLPLWPFVVWVLDYHKILSKLHSFTNSKNDQLLEYTSLWDIQRTRMSKY